MNATQTPSTRDVILDSGQRIMSRRGYAAVGLNEVLVDAGVPKGSFYHYFGSKDAFGEAMMRRYFVDYLADMDEIFARPDVDGATKVLAYFRSWMDNQSVDECQGKCLAVKLGAEVADLSEAIRRALEEGVAAITERLERVLDEGLDDGSVRLSTTARDTADALYSLWLGSSVITKITRSTVALETAMSSTRRLIAAS